MVLIFANKDVANTIAFEIAITPGGVALWFDPTDFGRYITDAEGNETWIPPKNVISYNEAVDNRCAVHHHWSAEDVAWLQEYLADVKGVTIADELPKDWATPEEGE